MVRKLVVTQSLDECINIVRQARANGVIDEPDMDQPLNQETNVIAVGPFENIYQDQVKEENVDGPVVIFDNIQEDGVVHEAAVETIIIPDGFYKNMNPSWSYRTRGESNSSSTTSFNLTIGLQLQRLFRQCQNPRVACLSDGVGGFTTVFDSFLKEGEILWHTLPETDIQEPKPIIVWNETAKNHIIYEHISQGFIDLTDDRTWDAFDTIIPLYHGITCDIELNLTIPEEYERYIMKIFANLIARLNRRGFFVLRLDLRFVRTCLSIVKVVRFMFQKTILWRPIHET